jgi:hypothetical protein
MKRVKLDAAPKSVKEFFRTLPLRSEGLELELDGKVVCEVIPPSALSAAERAELITRVRESARQSRRRNEEISQRVITREIGHAVRDVRRQKKA